MKILLLLALGVTPLLCQAPIGAIFNIANVGGISSSPNNPAAFGVPTSCAGQVFGSGGTRAFQLGGRFSFW